MSFVRRIVNSNVLAEVIDIPEGLKNRKVEILVFPLDDNAIAASKNQKPKRAKGLLAQYKNTSLIDKESSAWAEAMMEKHEHR